ncbi:unnamed protein product [Closterium sp. Yama58-4]|nr:unnamed protein product [Closterium sp. Yama58-4]
MLLAVRYSSPLFRLPSLELVQERVRFLNVGPTALPGVIVMSVTDGDAGSGMAQLDSRFRMLLLVVSMQPQLAHLHLPSLLSRNLVPHPLQEQHGMVPAVPGADPWFQADTAMLTPSPWWSSGSEPLFESAQHGMVPSQAAAAGPWFQADTAMLTVPPLAALALVELRE